MNNLYGLGFISGATTVSLPALSYPAAGTRSVCGSLDAICGGALMSILRPRTESVPSPTLWDIVNDNHKISTVPGYSDIWSGSR
ncbi:hypothetical protein D9M68_731690 [compost metagenome]